MALRCCNAGAGAGANLRPGPSKVPCPELLLLLLWPQGLEVDPLTGALLKKTSPTERAKLRAEQVAYAKQTDKGVSQLVEHVNYGGSKVVQSAGARSAGGGLAGHLDGHIPGQPTHCMLLWLALGYLQAQQAQQAAGLTGISEKKGFHHSCMIIWDCLGLCYAVVPAAAASAAAAAGKAMKVISKFGAKLAQNLGGAGEGSDAASSKSGSYNAAGL